MVNHDGELLAPAPVPAPLAGWMRTSGRAERGGLPHRPGSPQVDAPRRGRRLGRSGAPRGEAAAATGVCEVLAHGARSCVERADRRPRRLIEATVPGRGPGLLLPPRRRSLERCERWLREFCNERTRSSRRRREAPPISGAEASGKACSHDRSRAPSARHRPAPAARLRGPALSSTLVCARRPAVWVVDDLVAGGDHLLTPLAARPAGSPPARWAGCAQPRPGRSVRSLAHIPARRRAPASSTSMRRARRPVPGRCWCTARRAVCPGRSRAGSCSS